MKSVSGCRSHCCSVCRSLFDAQDASLKVYMVRSKTRDRRQARRYGPNAADSLGFLGGGGGTITGTSCSSGRLRFLFCVVRHADTAGLTLSMPTTPSPFACSRLMRPLSKPTTVRSSSSLFARYLFSVCSIFLISTNSDSSSAISAAVR